MSDIQKAITEIENAIAENRTANLENLDLRDIDFNQYESIKKNGRVSLNGASLNGASLNGASLNWASLNRASLNWNSHQLIGSLLWTNADTVERQLWAAWVGKKTEYCHERLFSTVAVHAPEVLAWAMPLMQSWIVEGDNAPSILKDWQPVISVDVEGE